jgi:SulP family sulfate permease
MSLPALIPGLRSLRHYDRSDLPGDLIASVIVTIMLIPQSLAYAMLADLPPQAGLYASILPLIGYALFGSSRALAVGPVAVLSLMTASAIGSVAAPGTAAHWEAAIILAAISGFILMVLGLLRLGFLANLLSHPVISGFISASAILIAVGQIKHLIGVSASGENLIAMLAQLALKADGLNWVTACIGGASLAFLFWARLWLGAMLARLGMAPRYSDITTRAAPVLAVILSTAAVAFFDLDQNAGVKIVGNIPAGLPPLTVPTFEPALWLQLAPAAALISLVGFVESVSVAQSLAAKRRQKIHPNQELVGLGAANLAASVSGGFPVTGGFARSGVNFAAGANTQLAAILTAILVALGAFFLAPAFYFMPHAALAATIVVAVIGLVDLHAIKEIWRYSKADAISLLVTAASVLALGVELGIAAGILTSFVLFLWRTSQPHIAVVGQVPGTEHYRNILRHKVVTHPEVLMIRVDENLYFLNARYLEEKIASLLAEHSEIRHLVLICSAVNYIDGSALDSLKSVRRNLADAGVSLHLAEVKGPVMDRLNHAGFLEDLGEVFLSTHRAMQVLGAEPKAHTLAAVEAALPRAASP